METPCLSPRELHPCPSSFIFGVVGLSCGVDHGTQDLSIASVGRDPEMLRGLFDALEDSGHGRVELDGLGCSSGGVARRYDKKGGGWGVMGFE